MFARTLPGKALLTLALVMTLATPAGAQDYAAAGRYFAAAQDAFEKGNYRKAAEQYQAAYDITQDPVLLFSIGEAWQRAGEGGRALKSYRAYLQAQPAASDRAEVERRIAALETAAGKPEAGKPEAGKPEAGKGTAEPGRPERIGPTQRQATGAEEKPGQTAEVRAAPLRFAAWTTVATGVALLTAGGVLGLGAQNRADELTRRTTLVSMGQPPIYNEAEREAYTSLVSEGRAYNSGAIACFALAGAAAVTSGVLFLLDWRRRAKAEQRPAVSSGARRGPPALAWSF